MPKGSCLCGAVSFEVAGGLAAPDACHCSQCIFVADKGDYYDIADGLLQNQH
jgi:hypothetical protein